MKKLIGYSIIMIAAVAFSADVSLETAKINETGWIQNRNNAITQLSDKNQLLSSYEKTLAEKQKAANTKRAYYSAKGKLHYEQDPSALQAVNDYNLKIMVINRDINNLKTYIANANYQIDYWSNAISRLTVVVPVVTNKVTTVVETNKVEVKPAIETNKIIVSEPVISTTQNSEVVNTEKPQVKKVQKPFNPWNKEAFIALCIFLVFAWLICRKTA